MMFGFGDRAPDLALDSSSIDPAADGSPSKASDLSSIGVKGHSVLKAEKGAATGTARRGVSGGGGAVQKVAAENPLITRTLLMRECGHFTMVNQTLHKTIDVVKTCRMWTEGVVASGVAACGLVGNLMSIWVLSVPQMRNTAFNR